MATKRAAGLAPATPKGSPEDFLRDLIAELVEALDRLGKAVECGAKAVAEAIRTQGNY